jgi:aminopeptidase
VADPRIEEYARLIVERSLDVQPGWQVVVRSTPLGRPLVEEVMRRIARRGAYPLLRLSLAKLWPVDATFTAEAPEEILGRVAPADAVTIEQMDARVTIEAPENAREGVDVTPERRALSSKAERLFFDRSDDPAFPWVSCQFPTPALAQEAQMTTREFEEFLFGAVLRDWDAEGRWMQVWADRVTAAETVRIVGAGTDVTLGVAGRETYLDVGKLNLPGGEFFLGPVEDATEGEITFGEFPTDFYGTRIEGIRLVFREGRVVEASARTGEQALLKALDTDEGARVVGELGIGCNEGITRYLRNTLFDEKMAGTIHLAMGASYEFTGGKNRSAIHWDIVKDLRTGGRIEVDGETVQENGRWLI